MIESIYRELIDRYMLENPDADFDAFALVDAACRDVAEWAYQQAVDVGAKHHLTFAPMIGA